MNTALDVESPTAHGVDPRYMVEGLARGLQLIRCLGLENRSLSLAEIAKRLGVTRSAAFRVTYTLEHLGYLHRDPNTKRHRLSLRVLELGYLAVASMHLPELAQPYLETLRDSTNASAHLGVLADHEVRYVGRAPSRLTFSSNIHVGSVLPAHATAMGKALLAWRPEAWVRDWLRGARLERFTSRTRIDPDDFVAELRCTRERGYAASEQEFEEGIRALAAPILDRAGKPVAAINVSGPATVMEADGATAILLLEVSAELSRAEKWRL